MVVLAERAITEVEHLDVLLAPGAGNRSTVVAMRNEALLRLEDDPRPPFDSGNAAAADPRLKELALRLLAASQV